MGFYTSHEIQSFSRIIMNFKNIILSKKSLFPISSLPKIPILYILDLLSLNTVCRKEPKCSFCDKIPELVFLLL